MLQGRWKAPWRSWWMGFWITQNCHIAWGSLFNREMLKERKPGVFPAVEKGWGARKIPGNLQTPREKESGLRKDRNQGSPNKASSSGLWPGHPGWPAPKAFISAPQEWHLWERAMIGPHDHVTVILLTVLPGPHWQEGRSKGSGVHPAHFRHGGSWWKCLSAPRSGPCLVGTASPGARGRAVLGADMWGSPLGCFPTCPIPRPLKTAEDGVSVLSFLYSLTLTSIHDYWKNHSFD